MRRERLLTMRVQDFAAKQHLILRSPPEAGVSKDGRKEILSNAIALPASGRGSARHALNLRASRWKRKIRSPAYTKLPTDNPIQTPTAPSPAWNARTQAVGNAIPQ